MIGVERRVARWVARWVGAALTVHISTYCAGLPSHRGGGARSACQWGYRRLQRVAQPGPCCPAAVMRVCEGGCLVQISDARAQMRPGRRVCGARGRSAPQSERGGHTCTSSGAPARSSSDTTSRSRRASPGLVVAALHASTTADSAVTPAALGAAGDTTAGEGQMRLWSGGCGKGQALSTYRRTCDELAHGEHVAAGGRGLERVRARRRTVGQRLAHRRRIAGVCRARQL